MQRSDSTSSAGSASYGEWDRRYIGNFVISAYSLSKGSNYVQQGDRVLIQRQKPKMPNAANVKGYASNGKTIAAGSARKQTKLAFGPSAAGAAGGKKAKVKEDYIVRFSNTKGFEVGRIPSDVSVWMSKVMDNDTASFEGVVVDCPPVLRVGCDLLLEIRAYMRRDAFATSPSNDVSFGSRNDDAPASAWGSETAESDEEKRLRERKLSLVRLFRACTLRPSQTNAILKGHTSNEDLGSEAMLEQYGGASQVLDNGSSPPASNGQAAEKKQAMPKTSSPPRDSRASTPDVDDGTELSENQLDSVYNRAQQHDLALPEVEPADSFALTLRPYQKQALGWMLKMEEKPHRHKRQGREVKALHPLWEEYIFPVDDERMDLLDSATSKFYFNPYTGHLSLRFQAASRGARGGILADEMGLGKTIQMASLILTNQPSLEEVSDDDEEIDADQQDEGSNTVATSRQMSLANSFAAASSSGLTPAELLSRRKTMLKMASASRGRVTLVVAPMSLVGQWRDEMERSIPTMRTMLYYAETKGDLVSRLEGGSVDIIVTSYGTLVTEYKRYIASNNAQSAARNAPLYAVDWLRVILDEAHQIKNKSTQNSRACRDLTARRRWCLTGTPIVNRLTDLFSLLRFLRVEPWGDFAFFNSFIAKPFMQKNPKALEIVQVVLESVLMRREKRMKDKDGKPIVDLPPKTTTVKRLTFSPLERQIYESVYERAYMQYQSLAAAGTISRNFTFIFSVLMRLRQAVCHPLLVLKGAKTVAKTDEARNEDMDEDSEEARKASVLGEAEERVKQLVAAFQAGADSIEEVQDGGAADKVSMEVLDELFGNHGEDAAESECPFCFEEKSELLVMPCKHWGCKSCIVDHLQRSEDRGEDAAKCPTCRHGPVTFSNSASVVRTRRDRLTEAIQSSQNEDKEPSSQPAVYFRKNDFRSSTKLEALVEHLNQLRYDDPTFKGVIFSQFTSFLDLVEVVLRRNHHPFVRLDGTTSQKDREAVLKEFANAPKRMLILVSLRAGGVGLNLVAANHVWLLDCWWNTSTEDQAVDRIHRLGQTRPVHVHRFLIDQSIEDRILAIQRRKTALVGAALAGTRGPGEKSEALQNLELLFS
jgi:DNA repair protein RAD5